MSTQNTQVNIQQEIQNLNEKLKGEIRKKLSSIPFPFEELSKDARIEVSSILKSVLSKCSLTKLKVDLPEYEKLVNQDYNLFSITFVLNAVSDLSAEDLGLTIEEYVKTVQLCYDLGKIHTKYAKPIQEKLQAEFQQKANSIQNQEVVVKAAEQKRKNKGVVPLKRMN